MTPSGFGRTVAAHVAPESGIYTPGLPGLAPEKTTLGAGVAQLARFSSPAGLKIPGLGFDVTDAGTATNEIQTLTIEEAEGGTLTLTFRGKESAAIAYNAAASAVEAKLEALSTIGVGNVEVSGSAGGPYTITFIGDLAGQDLPALTVDGAELTGESAEAEIEETEPGESVRCDVGIYDAELNLLGSNGGTAVAATAGAKALDFTAEVRIQPGRYYYAALASEGGAAKVLHMASVHAPAADLLGKTAGKRELVTLAEDGYPLPAAIPVGVNAGTKAPLMALRTVAAS